VSGFIIFQRITVSIAMPKILIELPELAQALIDLD
jgi:hypothetical protein